MKRGLIQGLLVVAFTANMPCLRSQDMGASRTNDLRFRWNIGQFANVGRYAFQFGVEKDFADNKTLSAEIGLSYFRANSSVLYQRYNYKGVQGLVEYRNYFRGFHDVKSKPFMALGLFARTLDFDADVTVAYNIENPRDWNSATHFEEAIAHYKTTTARLHAAVGVRMPISPTMYFELSGGPAFGFYHINHNLERSIPFVVDNFNNPFFMSSAEGNYFSPALYGTFSFGFVLAKSKTRAGQ
jgi:hypothetical protein